MKAKKKIPPEIVTIVKNMTLNTGANIESIAKLESNLKINLPSEYIEFMLTYNGGEGILGNQYLVLWKIEEIEELNVMYETSVFFPGNIFFGSDGADEAFAFKVISGSMEIVHLPFIGLPSDIRLITTSFYEFLKRLQSTM